MSTLPEQFSAARNAQIEAQLAFLGTFGARAVAGAEQLLSLNLRTSKAAFEQSSANLKQIQATKDPRDLLALTAQGQQQFDSLLAYGRALASIAAGVPAAGPAPAPVLAIAPAVADQTVTPEAAPTPPRALKAVKPAPFPTVAGKVAAPASAPADPSAPKPEKKSKGEK